MKGRVEWATEWWPAEETKGEAEATVGAAWWMAQSANVMSVIQDLLTFFLATWELICFIVNSFQNKKSSQNNGFLLVCKSS